MLVSCGWQKGFPGAVFGLSQRLKCVSHVASEVFRCLNEIRLPGWCRCIARGLGASFCPVFQISHRAQQIEFHSRDIELRILKPDETGALFHAILVGLLRRHRLPIGATLVHLGDGRSQRILRQLLLQVGDLLLRFQFAQAVPERQVAFIILYLRQLRLLAIMFCDCGGLLRFIVLDPIEDRPCRVDPYSNIVRSKVVGNTGL